MRPICIAHGGDMGEPSGGTDRVSAIAGGLADRGFDVHLVIPETDGELPARLDSVRIEFASTTDERPTLRASKVVRTARDTARAQDATLQIEHSSLAGIGTIHGIDGYVLDMHDLAYSRFDHVQSIATPVLQRGTRWLEQRAVDRATHIVVVSESMFDFLHEVWNVPAEQMTIIPNGYFPETVASFESLAPIQGRVGFFGTLHPKVDIDILRDVAELPAVTELVIIGDGALRHQVEELRQETETVTVTGRLPDAEAFRSLATASVLINPQTVSAIQQLSSPVKLYYYAALGKPMVVTSGPSIVEDLVRQGAAATAVGRGNFVSTVRRLLADAELATHLGANAKVAAEGFTWSDRVSDFATLHA